MDLKDKKVLVIGTGLSGIGSAELLVKKGAHVLLLEQNEKADRETI
jgi:UDP-N-acetylmuramoylalanine--D-glutamate ligase